MDEKNTKNMPSGSEVSEIWTLGGPVWINFANSRVLASKGMTDVTGSAEALIWWLGGMGLSAPNQPDAQDLAFAASLRETFARVLDNVQAGSSQSVSDVDFLNAVLRDQKTWQELEQLESGKIVVRERRATDTIQQALGPLVLSLSETLTKGDPARLRTCAHPDCVLRFYDDSKNGSRRWCSMSDCGNRAKATAYLGRQRSKTP
jgi:predicted RNA-binding Zn ribbon-like protein